MYSVGKVFNNTFGLEAKVIEVLPNKYRLIEFVDSGYKLKAHISNIKRGHFKDRKTRIPTVCGVGYTIEGATSKHPLLYRVWSRMLERCYTKNEPRKERWYKDVVVCERWHYFENFLEDATELEGYERFKENPSLYSLDKDIKGNGEVYSKDRCMFVTQEEQMIKSVGKPVLSISSHGERMYHKTINEACRKLGVQNANVYKVLNGERKTTLGYRFERP